MKHARMLDRYVAVFGTVLCLLLGAAAAWNLVVDPHALFPQVHAGSLEGFRRNADRTTKAERLSRRVPQVLLLGNSVANQLFDPESPAWAGREIYCGGLAGGNLVETETLFDFAMDRGRPELVVLVVDLRSVSGAEGFDGDWAESRLNPGLDGTDYLLRHLLGWGAARDGIDVVVASCNTDPLEAHTTAGGFRDRPPLPHTWESFSSIVRNYLHEEYNRFTYGRDRIEVVGRILERCRREGVRCIVVIPPQHAILMEAIEQVGLGGDFDRLRRDLAGVVEAGVRAAAEMSWNQPLLYDFSGWGGPRGEEVPLAGTATLRWFSDPVHGNAALGERMLRVIRPWSAHREGEHPLQGWRYSPAQAGTTVERTLQEAAIRRTLDRAVWAELHPGEASRIRRLVEETAPERARRRRLWGR